MKKLLSTILGFSVLLWGINPSASASNNPFPPPPGSNPVSLGFSPIFGAQAVVLFTAGEDRDLNIGTNPITPYLGQIKVLTPGVPQDIVIALPPQSFTQGHQRGNLYKLFLMKHPEANYYYPVYTSQVKDPQNVPATVPRYGGPQLDVHLDFQVQQYTHGSLRPTTPVPSLSLSSGARDLQLFARLQGTYSLTGLDLYVLAVPPDQSLSTLQQTEEAQGAAQSALSGHIVPILQNFALGPGKMLTIGSEQALPKAAPPALTYRIGADAMEGLYFFHAVVVEAGASPIDPANWIQSRSSAVFVSR